MSESILTSTKRVLGMDDTYTAFDVDITMHINTAFMILNQIGIGPDEGYQILDKTQEWGEFLGTDPRLNSVKSYVYLYVRLAFDPPGTSFAIASMKEQLDELLGRLSIHREMTDWTDPNVLEVSPE